MVDDETDSRQRFRDAQFALQLELEDLDDDQMYERGCQLRDEHARRESSRQQQVFDAQRVYIALFRSPLPALHEERRPGSDVAGFELMFEAFCRGLGIPAKEIVDDLNRGLQS